MPKTKLSTRARALLLAVEYASLGAGAVILLVFLASTLDANLIQNGQGAAVITSALVDLANTDRELNHVTQLTSSAQLTAIAQAKANDMAEKGYFAHTSPEGKSPWYWFTQGGYIFSYAGENLALDFSDSADVERAWMNSPGHRANLLNQHFTEIGIATAVGTYNGHQTTFVVQEFGMPAHPTAVTSIRATSTSTLAVRMPLKNSRPAPSFKHTTVTTSVATVIASGTIATTSKEVLSAVATGLTEPPSIYGAEGFASLWNVFAASPKTTLRYAYYLFGLLILIALVVETDIEFRKHHLRHVMAATALILLMGGLFLTANAFVFTTPVIADGVSGTQSP